MTDFVTRNKPDWEELERLLERSRRSLRRLTPEEVSRLDVLYRRVTVHLAQVRTRTRDVQLAAYLNHLAGTAHAIIYLPPRQRLIAGAAEFVAHGFAQSIARNWRYHFASVLLLTIGALLAFYATTNDSLAAYALLPAGEIRQPGATKEQLLEILRHGRDQGGGAKFLFASFLFAHNLKVGLLSMGLGVLACVPTVLLVLYNGMILGAFISVHTQVGVGTETWAWILPHGITEIGAIVLCGGIGLMLGTAVISPGRKTRAESLVRAGREAVRVTVGVGGMLCVAAMIESYLRQSHLSTAGRLMFAAGTAVFCTLYIAHGFVREARLKQRSVTEDPGNG